MKTRSDVSSNKTKENKLLEIRLPYPSWGSTWFDRIFRQPYFANREPELPEIPALTERQGDPVLTINSNKEKVNQIISFFLSEYQKIVILNINFIWKMKHYSMVLSKY